MEDLLETPRQVRCSVSSLANVGALIDGTGADLMADDSERPLEPGRAAFNRGEYFLAHELWEEVWRELGDAERRRHVQGLIQIAAGLHHLQRRRAGPAARLLRKGLEKLSLRRQDQEVFPDRLRTDLLAGEVARLLADLEDAKTPAAEASAAAGCGRLKL